MLAVVVNAGQRIDANRRVDASCVMTLQPDTQSISMHARASSPLFVVVARAARVHATRCVASLLRAHSPT